MKNILLLSSEFPPLPGGIGNHALHLALSLHKEGNEVTVVTNQRSSIYNEESTFDNELPFKVERIPRKIGALTYCNRIFKALQCVRNRKITTVLCSGKFSLWTGALLKKRYSNKKYIGILHGSEINAGGFLSKAITNWSMKQFDTLVAVSHFTKNLALEKNKDLQITVINNGFAFPKMDATPSDDIVIKGNPPILTVGNVTQRKGQQNVIKALPLLNETFPEIHYHVVGIPTEKVAFQKLAESLGVAENITFHNALSQEDLNDVLIQSKVFFMLSDTLKNGDVEGFGIAVLEANAHGIPAIGSKNSGIADAIQDGLSGKLVNPHDVNEIGLAFKDIMSNYTAYSKKAKEWSTQFTWDIVVKKYIAIIE